MGNARKSEEKNSLNYEIILMRHRVLTSFPGLIFPRFLNFRMIPEADFRSALSFTSASGKTR